MIQRKSFIAATATGLAMIASAATSQTPTSPTPTMSNNPGAAVTTDPGMAADPGAASATPGSDVMAMPASPDSSMSKGDVGRRHAKKHKPATMTPSAQGDVTSNTTAPR